jgi:prevent-host-death family protein
MTKAGLRELRQHASELVRLAERGETVTVTVSGREVAQLGPLQRMQWRTWEDAVAVFEGPSDDDWAKDRDLVDPGVSDPFAR